MIKIIVALLILLFAQVYFDNQCADYGWDKGAIFTLEGVFCERAVQDSFTSPYIPLNGARKRFENSQRPDPRWIPPPSPESPQG